jgi:hypothetical protein
MAEVGLLPFARIALQVGRAVLRRYRSRFSKRQFTQPQLLAILCLMRCEDWTFREAKVRLSEHRELRQVLGLVSVPDFTTTTSARPRRRGGRDSVSCVAISHIYKDACSLAQAKGLPSLIYHEPALEVRFVRRAACTTSYLTMSSLIGNVGDSGTVIAPLGG